MSLQHLRQEGLDNRSLELKRKLQQKLKQDMRKTILGIGLPVGATVLFNEISMELGESSVSSLIVRIGIGIGASLMAFARRIISADLENVVTEQLNIQEQDIDMAAA